MDKAKEILERIKEKKIKPRSRWKFMLKDYAIWIFFGLSILIGAMAFSVIIFLLNDNDWDVYKYLDKNFASYFLMSLPYVWIIILALFFFLAYFNYRHTKTGYRVNPIAIVLTSILISVFLGGIMFGSGFGRLIDIVLSRSIPYYERMLVYRQAVWNNPERGLLSGKIIEIENENNFSIRSFDGNDWEVVGDSIYWRGSAMQRPGERIKLIGKIKSGNVFEAREVRPWIGGKGRGMHRMNQK
ncbi:MAG: hypothetical protein PHH24_03085 [Candidatus Moranbacteria bacterium]|jgi:hypothetical protein|nr:hypothetical protein [Candidatus Moranbacteria bacterium]MDX9855225.1 hypothetical protein [Candidatus Moranbacteria bacterium]